MLYGSLIVGPRESNEFCSTQSNFHRLIHSQRFFKVVIYHPIHCYHVFFWFITVLWNLKSFVYKNLLFIKESLITSVHWKSNISWYKMKYQVLNNSSFMPHGILQSNDCTNNVNKGIMPNYSIAIIWRQFYQKFSRAVLGKAAVFSNPNDFWCKINQVVRNFSQASSKIL